MQTFAYVAHCSGPPSRSTAHPCSAKASCTRRNAKGHRKFSVGFRHGRASICKHTWSILIMVENVCELLVGQNKHWNLLGWGAFAERPRMEPIRPRHTYVEQPLDHQPTKNYTYYLKMIKTSPIARLSIRHSNGPRKSSRKPCQQRMLTQQIRAHAWACLAVKVPDRDRKHVVPQKLKCASLCVRPPCNSTSLFSLEHTKAALESITSSKSACS